MSLYRFHTLFHHTKTCCRWHIEMDCSNMNICQFACACAGSINSTCPFNWQPNSDMAQWNIPPVHAHLRWNVNHSIIIIPTDCLNAHSWATRLGVVPQMKSYTGTNSCTTQGRCLSHVSASCKCVFSLSATGSDTWTRRSYSSTLYRPALGGIPPVTKPGFCQILEKCLWTLCIHCIELFILVSFWSKLQL